MTDSNGGFAVRVPRRFQGIPAGISEAASGRDPISLEAIERLAREAIRNDPWRAFEWIQFIETPLPATTVNQKVATNARRGPMDAAELAIVQKTTYSPNWRACKPERVKNGKTLPAEMPTTFASEQEAQATLERFHRLGTQAGVPLANHLSYGVVAPLSEWEATAGQPTVDREREQLQREVELEQLRVQKRHADERIRELLNKAESDLREAIPEDSEAKVDAMLAAVDKGEPVVSVAKRFGVADRTIRRYRAKRAEQQQPEPVVGQVIDPALLGEDV